jgi:hypothetical protein
LSPHHSTVLNQRGHVVRPSAVDRTHLLALRQELLAAYRVGKFQHDPTRKIHRWEPDRDPLSAFPILQELLKAAPERAAAFNALDIGEQHHVDPSSGHTTVYLFTDGHAVSEPFDPGQVGAEDPTHVDSKLTRDQIVRNTAEKTQRQLNHGYTAILAMRGSDIDTDELISAGGHYYFEELDPSGKGRSRTVVPLASGTVVDYFGRPLTTRSGVKLLGLHGTSRVTKPIGSPPRTGAHTVQPYELFLIVTKHPRLRASPNLQLFTVEQAQAELDRLRREASLAAE